MDSTLSRWQPRRPRARKTASLQVAYSGGLVPAEPTRLTLARGATVLGRALEVDGQRVLSDPSISRRHAEIEVGRDISRPRLRDLDSRHGVRVNGRPVREATLEDGDVIGLGDSLMVFRAGPVGENVEIPELLGTSPAAQTLRREIAMVASEPFPVLLLGETGVGKTLAAEAIHRLSGRRGRFVDLNCSAIPTGLAPSELFGHTKGAFTGADVSGEGHFAAANGGTLFLDEVAELPAEVQANLLKVLDQGYVTPVGSTRQRHVDVRVVAATNADLDDAVSAERFRNDLLARLSGVEIEVAPLRARREDILGLFSHFLDDPWRPSSALAERLIVLTWPGNVRELRATALEGMARAKASGDADGVIEVEDLGRRLGPEVETPCERVQHPAPQTKEELAELLATYKGNVSRLADDTGRSRKQVYRWAEQFGLDPRDFRSK